MISTSTIDLASLHGYQLQLQLASLSPHQLVIPVSSSGIGSNLTDHFIIPVNMTPAVITSSADQAPTQAGFIVQNVSAATENQGVVDSPRGVELAQALVQTDLSIPIPARDMTQEDLASANIQGNHAFAALILFRPNSSNFVSRDEQLFNVVVTIATFSTMGRMAGKGWGSCSTYAQLVLDSVESYNQRILYSSFVEHGGKCKKLRINSLPQLRALIFAVEKYVFLVISFCLISFQIYSRKITELFV